MPDGGCYRFSPSGTDEVCFEAATNPGEPRQPLDRIASTGEASRFLLALKSALAEADTVPVLIFDEIDIGVGGRSGEVIGRKLWGLSQRHQVICVTHLRRSRLCRAHFRVSKRTSSGGRQRLRNCAARTCRELAAILPAPHTAGSLAAARR
jgi:DNA repair protein RecN (Recombination protein N)